MAMYYKGINVGTRRVDFMVNDLIVVELKAVSELNDIHFAQALNYSEAYKLDTGLLLNFGSKSLEKRIIINEYKLKNRQIT